MDWLGAAILNKLVPCTYDCDYDYNAVDDCDNDDDNDYAKEVIFCFSVVTKDSGCNSKVTAGNIVKLFTEEKVDAFIGPPCSAGKNKAAFNLLDHPVLQAHVGAQQQHLA